jgi:hypothetical protein
MQAYLTCYLMTVNRVHISQREIHFQYSLCNATGSEDGLFQKYVSHTGLGKLRNIAANSCYKLEFQPSFEFCGCRKQFIRVSCCRNPVNVLLYQEIPKTHMRTLIPITVTLNMYKSFCRNVPEVMFTRRTKS